MSADYDQLLDATITYFEQLKAQGTRYVPVLPETLAGLSRAAASLPQIRSQPGTPAPVTATSAKASAVLMDGVAVVPKLPPVFSPTLTLTSAAPLTPGTPLSLDAKTQAIAELRERAMVCVKCPNLVASRKNVVFGVGDISSQIMFVGEAPGAEEDEQGEPFIGAAGQLLTKIIQTMGLSRQTVYIANILKCRPDTPGQTFGNRKPTPDEMKTCVPYLHAQVDLIQPKVLVALGSTAIEGLLSKPAYITKIRGQWHTYRGIPLMPTFHPSYLLRTEALQDKRRVWEDMLQVMEKVGLPVSDKQRGYFLKG
ncbi:MAG: Phage polymerase-related protein [Verrucomicrobiales bacterium]|nr:Phage polymerase-related protein [Verrucomicrobiales bacterium]